MRLVTNSELHIRQPVVWNFIYPEDRTWSATEAKRLVANKTHPYTRIWYRLYKVTL